MGLGSGRLGSLQGLADTLHVGDAHPGPLDGEEQAGIALAEAAIEGFLDTIPGNVVDGEDLNAALGAPLTPCSITKHLRNFEDQE